MRRVLVATVHCGDLEGDVDLEGEVESEEEEYFAGEGLRGGVPHTFGAKISGPAFCMKLVEKFTKARICLRNEKRVTVVDPKRLLLKMPARSTA